MNNSVLVKWIFETVFTSRTSILDLIYNSPCVFEWISIISPAFTEHSANAKAVRGVSSAGFITQVQPAAKAAPAFRVIIAKGKFHYNIKPIMRNLLSFKGKKTEPPD